MLEQRRRLGQFCPYRSGFVLGPLRLTQAMPLPHSVPGRARAEKCAQLHIRSEHRSMAQNREQAVGWFALPHRAVLLVAHVLQVDHAPRALPYEKNKPLRDLELNRDSPEHFCSRRMHFVLSTACGGSPDTVPRSVGAGRAAPAHTPAPTVAGTVSCAQAGPKGREKGCIQLNQQCRDYN